MIYDADKRINEIDTGVKQLLKERLIPDAGILSAMGHHIYKDLADKLTKLENDLKGDPFIAHSFIMTEKGPTSIEDWTKHVRGWLNQFKNKYIRNNRFL